MSGFVEEDFDLGVSARTVLLDFVVPSSLRDLRLDEDLLTSARILIFAFLLALSFSFSLSLSDEPFSSSPTAGLPLRDDG